MVLFPSIAKVKTSSMGQAAGPLLQRSFQNLKETCGIVGSKNVNFSPVYFSLEQLGQKLLPIR